MARSFLEFLENIIPGRSTTVYGPEAPVYGPQNYPRDPIAQTPLPKGKTGSLVPQNTPPPPPPIIPGGAGPGGAQAGGAQQQDPMTTFNMEVLNMLKQAQGVGPASALKQQRLLREAAIKKSSDITPEDLRGLSPQQQAAIRQGGMEALKPEMDAVADQIKMQDVRLQNFERSLGTLRDIGSDMLKNVSPSPEVIEGYLGMLRAGGSPTAIPDEVRGKILAKADATVWNAWKAANASASGGGTAGERKDAQIEEFLRKSTELLFAPVNRTSPAGTVSKNKVTPTQLDPQLYNELRREYVIKFGDASAFDAAFQRNLASEEASQYSKYGTQKVDTGSTRPTFSQP